MRSAVSKDHLRLRANGRNNSRHCCANYVASCWCASGCNNSQQCCVRHGATMLVNNSQHCWTFCVRLHTVLHVLGCCCVLLHSLKPVKLFSQQLPTFLLFRDRRSVAKQCWIHLHSSSNTVRATHAHFAWFTGVIASVYTPLRTRKQQLPTLLAQQCSELLRPLARSRSNPAHLRFMTERKGQVFVDERAIIVQLRWVLWSQRARGRSTCNLQISRWHFGAESSIILKFIALRVESRGDGPFFCSQHLILLCG